MPGLVRAPGALRPRRAPICKGRHGEGTLMTESQGLSGSRVVGELRETATVELMIIYVLED